MHCQVRCKMKCDWVQDHGSMKRIRFSAVCADEVPENQRYHKFTPNGFVEIEVTNLNVTYIPGKYYYFDSTLVEL